MDLDVSIDLKSLNVSWRSTMGESSESFSIGEDLETVGFVDNGQVKAEKIVIRVYFGKIF